MQSKPELEKEVLMAMRENGIASVLFRNATGRKLGLNITDYECLSFLSLRGSSTPTEIARYTGLSTGSTTAMLDRLEKVQFITRQPNPSDRRGVLVEINPHYQQLASPLVRGMQQSHRELLSRFSAKELEVIADFVNGFVENVKEATSIIENR